MECSNCGKSVPEHTKFCSKCGQQIQRPTSTDSVPEGATTTPDNQSKGPGLGAVLAGMALVGAVKWLAKGADSSQLATQHYEQGRVLADNQRIQEALKEYYKCLEYDPNHADAHNNIAWELAIHMQHLDKALQHITQAIKLKSDEYMFIDTLCEVLFARRDYSRVLDLSKDLLVRIKSTNPDDSVSMFNLYFRVGRVFLGMEQFDTSLKYLSESELHQPQPPFTLAVVRYYKAVAYYQMNEYTKALECLEQAINEEPRDEFLSLQNTIIEEFYALFLQGVILKEQLENAYRIVNETKNTVIPERPVNNRKKEADEDDDKDLIEFELTQLKKKRKEMKKSIIELQAQISIIDTSSVEINRRIERFEEEVKKTDDKIAKLQKKLNP
jgi:tetratricopeptide (TPR) repeat protein